MADHSRQVKIPGHNDLISLIVLSVVAIVLFFLMGR